MRFVLFMVCRKIERKIALAKWSSRLSLLTILFVFSIPMSAQAQTEEYTGKRDRFHLSEFRASLTYIHATARSRIGVPLESWTTGFFVDKEGNILTSYHLLSSLKDYQPDTLRIDVRRLHKETRPLRAEIVDAKEARDILRLKLVNPFLAAPPCVSTNSSPSSLINSTVSTAGFPKDLPFAFATGRILSSDGPNGSLVADIAVQPGQSGSPVFLENGTVVGIIKGQMEDGTGAAIPGRVIVIPMTDAHSILPASVGRPNCAGGDRSYTDVGALEEGTDQSVDIILIVDDSASMFQDQRKLGAALAQMLAVDSGSVDARLCLLTTDVNHFGGAPLGWLDKTHDQELGPVLQVGNEDFSQIIVDTFDIIGAEWSSDEQAIRSFHEHLRHYGSAGCFRKKGVLLVIVLSDENERSTGGNRDWSHAQYKPLMTENTPSSLIGLVETMLPGKTFIWNSIIVVPGDVDCEAEQDEGVAPSFFGTLYAELSTATGGYIGSICSEDYNQHLEEMGSIIGPMIQ